MMRNHELAKVFEQIAELMEIAGEDKFRVSSYHRAARAIDELPRDVAEMLADGELADVPGIGKGTLGRIEEYLKKGQITVHQELMGKLPPGLLKLLEIPGLGPKTASLAWKELGVKDLDGLKRVIEDGSLAKLPGMGEKKVRNIQAGIQFLSGTAGRTPLGVALPIATELAARLAKLAGVSRAEPAGSLRRRAETIGDIDILVQAEDGAGVVEAFVKFPEVTAVLASGPTKGSVRVVDEIQVDVRVVPAESFGAALQYFTGSKAHNIRLRELAVKRKWKLNEYGLFEGEKPIAGKDEEGIYKALGLPWIPPEMREDRGEIEHASSLPKLLEASDIRGDLHVHTTASDGLRTIDEMIEACTERGYEYVAITDHSKSSRIANGLDEKRMALHLKEIRRAARKYAKKILVLTGCECDILADGSLDYDDALLAEIDVVTASLHSGLGQPAEKITARLLKAMDNPHVRIIGHPTGRMIGQRDAANLDMNAVIAHAKATGTFLELNASWQRLDLKDVHLRQAKEADVKIAICTDAHDAHQLDQMIYGVYTARRGWLEANDVINARPAAKLRKLLASKK